LSSAFLLDLSSQNCISDIYYVQSKCIRCIFVATNMNWNESMKFITNLDFDIVLRKKIYCQLTMTKKYFVERIGNKKIHFWWSAYRTFAVLWVSSKLNKIKIALRHLIFQFTWYANVDNNTSIFYPFLKVKSKYLFNRLLYLHFDSLIDHQ
jgi:hypothetical protein